MPGNLQISEADKTQWLRNYYTARAVFSIIWVTIAFSLAKTPSPFAGFLLVLYPACDAAANWHDASQHGGLRANPTQAFNALVSTVVTIVAIAAILYDGHAVLYVFGAWASLSGLLQLGTGIRRWKHVGAQWPMILSGVQSTLGGLFFIKEATAGITASAADIAPYAAFGALYFAISAITLALSLARSRRTGAAA